MPEPSIDNIVCFCRSASFGYEYGLPLKDWKYPNQVVILPF